MSKVRFLMQIGGFCLKMSTFVTRYPSLGKRLRNLLNKSPLYNNPNIILLALSTTDVSNDAR